MSTTSAAEALRQFLAPLLPGYELQFGAWVDKALPHATRFAVLRPVGGPRVEILRRPQFTLTLIGMDGGDVLETAEAADTVVAALKAGGEGLVFAQPAEPVFIPTADRRPMFEVAIAAITD